MGPVVGELTDTITWIVAVKLLQGIRHSLVGLTRRPADSGPSRVCSMSAWANV